MKYYIYIHIRHDNGEVFYVGKGSIHKRHSDPYHRAHSKRGRNPIWKKIVNKTTYSTSIVYQSDVESEIFSKEVEFIKLYGRKDLKTGTLSNLTDGGEGPVGISDELRAYYSLTRKGKKAARGSWESKCKKVYQYKLSGEFIREYESQRLAARDNHTRGSDISKAVRGINLTAGNFQWKDFKTDRLN